MEKKKKGSPRENLSRTTIIAGIVMVLAAVVHIAFLFIVVGNISLHYNGYIIYPVLRIWQVIDLLIIFIIIGTNLVIGLKVVFRPKYLAILIIRFLFLASLCYITAGIYFLKPTFEETEIIRFGDNVYYLILVEHFDFDYNDTSQIVYECDSWGIICQNINSHYQNYFESASPSPTEFTLSDDKTELYVIIGEEQFLIKELDAP